MLVALGILLAGFVMLLVLPLYRRRTERLAVDAVKRALPMSEAEIRADKDRLRAEYAIRIHQLESRVDEAGEQAARQRIELNRRDGRINSLESEITALKSSLDEHENARRVLEQTITDRLPKVEVRLGQARELLTERDREIERLTRTADQTARALDEARQLNTQQRDELMRSNATLASRAARNRETLADTRFDGEVALRSEIEALRARTREQAEMITRLQGLMVRGGGEQKAGAAAADGEAVARDPGEREIARLRAALAETEAALNAARSTADQTRAGHRETNAELGALKRLNEDLQGEVARLKSSLAVYEGSQKDEAAIRDSKVAMKARLGALETEVQMQQRTIQSLRAEVAAANERLALQAAHYRDELRRLGAGTLPTSAEPQPPRREERRATLAERMGAPRAVALTPVATSGAGKEEARSAEFLKAVVGGPPEAVAANDAPPASAAAGQGVAAHEDVVEELEAARPAAESPRRRASLIDRISNVGKSGS